MENKPRVYQPLEYDEMPGEMVMLADYAKLETERDDAQRRANLAIGCLEVKEQLNEALRAKDEENKVMHREIIDQGRKVLNATSEIGMSQTEFIEWVIGELDK